MRPPRPLMRFLCNGVASGATWRQALTLWSTGVVSPGPALVADFLRLLVPADAVAHVRPQLPLDALGRRLGQLQQVPGLRERVERRIGRYQLRVLGGQGGQLGQVAGDRPPPAPVRAE